MSEVLLYVGLAAVIGVIIWFVSAAKKARLARNCAKCDVPMTWVEEVTAEDMGDRDILRTYTCPQCGAQMTETDHYFNDPAD